MIDMSENDFGVLVRPTEGTEDDESYGTMEVSVFSNSCLMYRMIPMLGTCS